MTERLRAHLSPLFLPECLLAAGLDAVQSPGPQAAVQRHAGRQASRAEAGSAPGAGRGRRRRRRRGQVATAAGGGPAPWRQRVAAARVGGVVPGDAAGQQRVAVFLAPSQLLLTLLVSLLSQILHVFAQLRVNTLSRPLQIYNRRTSRGAGGAAAPTLGQFDFWAMTKIWAEGPGRGF